MTAGGIVDEPGASPDAPLSGAEFRRRRRARNYALLAVLLALVALFYAITLVQIAR